MPQTTIGFLLAVILGLYFLSAAIYVLREYERGVVFRLGRLIPVKGPGFIVIIPIIDRLIKGLFDFRLSVGRVMRAKDGIVTRGGVNTKEINPKTMESRLLKGLFFAGEVIDIDATTGGYNMQAAFSTGWVCGDNI